MYNFYLKDVIAATERESETDGQPAEDPSRTKNIRNKENPLSERVYQIEIHPRIKKTQVRKKFQTLRSQL